MHAKDFALWYKNYLPLSSIRHLSNLLHLYKSENLPKVFFPDMYMYLYNNVLAL